MTTESIPLTGRHKTRKREIAVRFLFFVLSTYIPYNDNFAA